MKLFNKKKKLWNENILKSEPKNCTNVKKKFHDYSKVKLLVVALKDKVYSKW